MDQQNENQPETGKVIMFDGPNGVGKTTQMDLARTELERRGFTVFKTRVHGGTPIGEALRDASLSNVDRPPLTDLYISLAAHAALVEIVNQQRHNGFVTLIDRSPLSIIAYQVYGSGLDKDQTLTLVDKSMQDFNPDLVILYNAPRSVTKNRLDNSNMPNDFFEDKPDDYQERIHEGYVFAAERYQAKAIDASVDIATIHRETMRLIDEVIADAHAQAPAQTT
jgi:dTMP kinase